MARPGAAPRRSPGSGHHALPDAPGIMLSSLGRSRKELSGCCRRTASPATDAGPPGGVTLWHGRRAGTTGSLAGSRRLPHLPSGARTVRVPGRVGVLRPRLAPPPRTNGGPVAWGRPPAGGVGRSTSRHAGGVPEPVLTGSTFRAATRCTNAASSGRARCTAPGQTARTRTIASPGRGRTRRGTSNGRRADRRGGAGQTLGVS
jgi:hypothetical protein